MIIYQNRNVSNLGHLGIQQQENMGIQPIGSRLVNLNLVTPPTIVGIRYLQTEREHWRFQQKLVLKQHRLIVHPQTTYLTSKR